MAVCGLFALVLGYLAGLRFRVMIVLPIEIAALAAAALLTIIGKLGAGEAFLGFTIFSIAVQAGYALALAYPLSARSAAAHPPLKA